MNSRSMQSMIVLPGNNAFGSDLSGLDFLNASVADIAFVRQAWLTHGVLRFRNCNIDAATQVAFARRFGDLDFNPGTRLTGRIYVAGYPELVCVSNIVEDGVPIGELGAGEADWHTDMCFVDVPPAASLLRAIEIPSEGGNTSFLDMAGMLDALPEGLRHEIAGLSIKHDGVYASSGKQRAGTTAPASGDIRDISGAVHPIVQMHPETGRSVLYLGKRFNAYVVGLSISESEGLLDRLWTQVLAAPSRYVWTQSWRVGDMIMWDNRRTMHRREAFDGSSRRLLHRAVVKGQRVLPG